MTDTTNFHKVIEFHQAFGASLSPTPQLNFDPDLINLRLNLIDEEYNELLDGLNAKDIVEVADALTDLLYVIYGFGCSLGIDLDKTFEEVHKSNMTKLGPDGKVERRPDGKITKGKSFVAPNLRDVLDHQQPIIR